MSYPTEPALPDSNAVECFRRVPDWSLRQLWCFGHAGAGAAEFAGWAEYMSADFLVCAVRLPARERRLGATAITDMAELTRALLPDIAPLIGPDAVFYGQCLGAIVAFELTGELERAGTFTPSHLYLASQLPPGRLIAEARDGYESLGDAEFKLVVSESGGLPPGLDENSQLWELVEPGLRADYQLLANYSVPAPPISVPITTLLGSADRTLSAGDMTGWWEYTSAAVSHYVVPGTHFLNRSPPSPVIHLIQASAGSNPG
jgi:medium-chain acyl-[acyl-carrier-protein] hydrolase